MPLHAALAYVIGAYLVFVALLLAYTGIMATKAVRVRREFASLSKAVEEHDK
jgi:hypothetical protein